LPDHVGPDSRSPLGIPQSGAPNESLSIVVLEGVTLVTPRGTKMPVRKRSYSLDERAAAYVDRRSKKLKRSASAVLSDLVLEAAQQEARSRALEELGAGVQIPEREVQRWLRKLGAT
jgi:hypothetical protein